MNRREFLSLIAVAVSGPSAIAMLPAPVPVAISAQPTLYAILRQHQLSARNDMARHFEAMFFRSLGGSP